MSQIKVGDKVRIKTEEELEKEEYFYALHGGKTGTVKKVRPMNDIYAISVETEDRMLHLSSERVKKLPKIPEHLFEIE